MRKTILFLALVVALANQSLFAQVPSYVPTNGLVGYWPFNGNANDESGNGNNGTVNGATSTIDRFGNASNAYSFDGADDNITLKPINTINGISVAFWTNQINPTLGGHIITQSEFNNPPSPLNWAFDYLPNTPNHANKAGSFKGLYNSLCNGWIDNESWYNTLDVSGWNCVIFTINNSGLIKQYLNGEMVNSAQGQLFPNCNFDPKSTLRFGGPWITSDLLFFNGIIDDIGIWNRALTQQEITNLYNSVSSNECLTMTINTGVLSTNPFTYISSVSIYPNPANDQITIDCGNLANVSGWSIKITNMQGQEVFSQPMNTQQYVLPLNTWSGQGMYFVKIINAQNEVVNIKKIILH